MTNQLETAKNAIDTVRSQLVNAAIFTCAILGFPIAGASLYRAMETGWKNVMFLHVGVVIVFCFTAILHRRLSFNLRVSVFLSLFLIMGSANIFSFGLVGMGLLFFIVCSTLATILFGTRSGIIIIAVSLIVMVVTGFCVRQGIVIFDFDANNYAVALSSWATAVIASILFMSIIVACLGRFHNSLILSNLELNKRTSELEKANIRLKEEIAERKRTEGLISIQRDLATGLNTAKSLNEGLEFCLEASLKVSEMDCGTIYLKNDNSGTFDLVSHKGLKADCVGKPHFNFNSEYAEPLMAGEPVYTQYPNLSVPVNEDERKENLHANAILPVSRNNQIIGCLNVVSYSIDEIPAYSRDALEIVAVQMGNSVAKLQAEEEIARTKNYLESSLSCTPDGVTLLDKHGKFKFLNPALLTWLGRKEESFLGKTIREVTPPYMTLETGRIIAERVKNRLKTGDSITGAEIEIIDKDGRLMPISYSAAVIKDKNGEILGEVIFLKDITEQNRIKGELLKHRDHLEDLVKERTEALETAQKELIRHERMSVLGRLISTVSHELRNPLGVIRSSIFYLGNKLRSDDQKSVKHIKRIDTQIDQCNSIIADLMEYSEGQRSVVFYGQINSFLKDTLNGIIENEETDISLVNELSTELPLALFDNEKMKIVVENICENAIHAIREKNEHIANESEGYQPVVKAITSMTEKGVKIEIEDNGIGMDPETLKQAFDPLFTTKTQGSTGLGLAIAIKIIEEHNGTVTIESKPNQGTRVSITVPVENWI